MINKFMSIKQAAIETGLKEYTIRTYCKQKRIRFNIAGGTKYIVRLDWLEEDLNKMALDNMKSDKVQLGTLRKINA